jgi:hypothetical protein
VDGEIEKVHRERKSGLGRREIVGTFIWEGQGEEV